MTSETFISELFSEAAAPLLVLCIGIPASGKTTFCRRMLEVCDIDCISLDILKTRAREKTAFDAALASRRSVVIDNTNVTRTFRARCIEPAKAAGCRVVGLFFQSVPSDCLARNEKREGKARIKRLALLGMSCEQMGTATFGYTQSDEMSILVSEDLCDPGHEPWFDRRQGARSQAFREGRCLFDIRRLKMYNAHKCEGV